MPKNTRAPLVSVIIPCYNSGATLEEAVASALKQTYSQVEIIIVDDGSTDDFTRDLLRSYLRPKTAIYHIPHSGPAQARNFAIAKARGKYILPLDADDRIHPRYLEKAVPVMEKNERIGIVYCRAQFFGGRSGEWVLPRYSLENILVDNPIFNTALFRKKAWEQVGGYNVNMTHGMEDYDFWLSLIEQEKCRVHRINQVLFYYRIRNGSRTARMAQNGHEAEMFTRIFYNHQALFLHDRHMRCLFRRRVEMVNEIKHLQHMINFSPALKIEKRLEKYPRARVAYYRFFDGLVYLIRGWRWLWRRLIP